MSAQRKNAPRLGRGLESLLGGARPDISEPIPESTPVAESETPYGGIKQVPVAQIRPNPVQPRLGFTERDMGDLTESVRELGILQPLLVRRVDDGYELIAGERRLRAATAVGLEQVPVVERETSDDDMLTIALVENLQRADLNPMEKAHGFKNLIDDYELTQDEAAKRVGKDRSTVANFMRLLDLPEAVQHIVSRGTIAMGHARALLGLPHPSAQQALALRIENEGLSVRETERIVSEQRPDKPKHAKRATPPRDPHIRDLEDRVRERLGTKVKIDYKAGKGRVTVMFYSDDDLQRFLDIVNI
jgi:ParB family transcriptional regulator, chromosome partitioning protein